MHRNCSSFQETAKRPQGRGINHNNRSEFESKRPGSRPGRICNYYARINTSKPDPDQSGPRAAILVCKLAIAAERMRQATGRGTQPRAQQQFILYRQQGSAEQQQIIKADLLHSKEICKARTNRKQQRSRGNLGGGEPQHQGCGHPPP